MANLGQNFNASEHEDMADFSPIPVGDYIVVMKSSEVKNTKSGNGSYLNCTFEIIDGKYRGRLLFSILNLWNENPTAVKIAHQELATIGRACGVLAATDSSQFHNKPMIAHVAIEQGDPKYGPKNVIKNYKPVNSDAPVSATTPVPSEEAPSPLPDRPWERR